MTFATPQPIRMNRRTTAGHRTGRALACTVAAIAVWLSPATLRADPCPESARPTILLVVGASGEPRFGSNFLHQVETWKRIATRASAQWTALGETNARGSTARELLERRLRSEPRAGSGPLWVVLMGHGTFDGEIARFNLRGPDVSAAELADWLQPFTRPLVVINTASASAPFLNKLSGTNRVIVTATRSGNEQYFTRFGAYLAPAFADADSDLDGDDQVSVLEAFLVASSQVAEFYRTAGRLATEHALIDDNGDGKGTPAEWFRGVRAVRMPTEGEQVDGARARRVHLLLSPAEQALPAEFRARRDILERSIATLREAKPGLDGDEYYQQLEAILLQLARLYATIDAPDETGDPP